MTTKTAAALLEGDGLRFTVTTGSGHRLVLDDAAGDQGPRPAELIPVSIAGCTGMDVISILRKKRQVVTRYEVRAAGEQRDGEHPAVFTHVDVVHLVEGPSLDVAAVRRAIELSATRYCSVGGTLSTGATRVRHAYVVRDGAGGEAMGEVVVTGPFEEPGTLGSRPTAGAASG